MSLRRLAGSICIIVRSASVRACRRSAGPVDFVQAGIALGVLIDSFTFGNAEAWCRLQ